MLNTKIVINSLYVLNNYTGERNIHAVQSFSMYLQERRMVDKQWDRGGSSVESRKTTSSWQKQSTVEVNI